MTAFATITLDDGQGTPAPVDFAPSSIDSNGVARLFAESSDGLDSRRSISLGVRLPKNGGPVARVTAKVVVPVMDPNDSSIKLGDSIANIEFVIPKMASLDIRKDLLAFAQGFLSDVSVASAVQELESIY